MVRFDAGGVRLAIFAAMAVMFLVSLTIPEAFDDLPGGLHAPLLLAGCDLAVRVLHLVAYAVAGRGDDGLLRVLRRVSVPMLAGTGILALAAFTSGLLQLALWVVALVVDYVGVYLAGADGWRVPSPVRSAERHGLIVIIALGESIVAIGVGIQALPMSWLVVLTATLGLGIAAGLWWMYFDVVARAAEHRLARATGVERAAIARDSYTYLHFPIVAGIVFLALGLKKALEYVADPVAHAPTEPLSAIPPLPWWRSAA